MEAYLSFVQNHPALFAALGVILVLIVANEVHGQLTGGKRLSIPEAVRLINDRDPLILDVRAPGDYKRGHLLNAINVPAARIDERAGELGKDKSRPVLVYCALGGSAAEVAKKLHKLGYSQAYPLRGGINGWLSANLPITSK